MRSPYAETRAPRRTDKRRTARDSVALRPVTLSRKAQAKWLREAQELQAGAVVQRELERAALDCDEQRGASLADLLARPVVSLEAEKCSLALVASIALAPVASAQQSEQRSDSQPALGIIRHERVQKAIYKYARHSNGKMQRRNGHPIAIAPLISNEMRLRLQTHLEAKIQGNIWENEIRSRLARPLSASTFCCRDERLAHPLAARKLLDEMSTPSGQMQSAHSGEDDSPLFPYSVEAHTFARQIYRCYRTFRFRIDVLVALRHLAIAIRVLRRRAIPVIIKGFRRRRRAAVRIQRRFRRYIGWKERVLRPFVAQQVWAAQWLRHKRDENVAAMWKELQALEAIERRVHTEYKAILGTSFGKRLLKKELMAWRKITRSPAPVDLERPRGIDNDGEAAESDQFVRLKQCFAVFDFDQSGSLDLDEFELLLAYLRGKPPRKPGRQLTEAQRRAIPPRLTTAQIRNLFNDLDVDGSGKVTYEELQGWWQAHMDSRSSTSLSSASSSYLSGGLDRLLQHSHGLLFWLLGRKQQLEKKFVKKLMVKRAQNEAKLAFLHEQIISADQGGAKAFRCTHCARRFGLRRDLWEHQPASGGGCSDGEGIVSDTFVLKKWIHEEEFRLLDE